MGPAPGFSSDCAPLRFLWRGAQVRTIIAGFALPHRFPTLRVAYIQKEYACVTTKSFC
jgi:hypothetical protein